MYRGFAPPALEVRHRPAHRWLIALVALAMLATFAVTGERAGATSVECSEGGYWHVPGHPLSPESRGISCEEPKPIGWVFSWEQPGFVILVYHGTRLVTPYSDGGHDSPVLTKIQTVNAPGHQRAPVNAVGTVVYRAGRNNRVVIGSDGNCYREWRTNRGWGRSSSYGSDTCRRAAWNAWRRSQLLPLYGMRIPAGSPPDERVTELVSNRDHSPDGQAGNAGHDHAQSFTTGSHSNGYVVRSIDLYFSFVIPGGNRGPTTVVQIWTNSDDNRPSEELATLSGHSRLDSAGSGSTRPFTFSAGERRFVALDEGIHLDPDTTYWVFLDWTPDGNNSPRLRTTTSAEESQAESGWSIGDSSFYRSQGATTWTEWGYSHKLTIDGYPK